MAGAERGLRIMKILDVFSWLSAKELSMEEIENTVIGLQEGNSRYEGYLLERQIPEDANENVTDCANRLVSEGKKVCFLLRAGKTVAVIGYKD